jgi:hypothetical protein
MLYRQIGRSLRDDNHKKDISFLRALRRLRVSERLYKFFTVLEFIDTGEDRKNCPNDEIKPIVEENFLPHGVI